MRTSSPPLLPVLRSGTQLGILGALYVGPRREWSVSSLADHLGETISSVAREVARLEEAGVVRAEYVGRSKLVTANWDLPWAPALARLLEQTIGPMVLIGEALGTVNGVDQAWIFGPWAARHAGVPGPPIHEIGVVVIGDHADEWEAGGACSEVSQRIGIPISCHLADRSTWEDPEAGSRIAAIKKRPLTEVPILGGYRVDGRTAVPWPRSRPVWVEPAER